MKLYYLVPLAIFVVLVTLLGIGLTLDPSEVPSPLIGKPAPAFQLPALDDTSRTVTRDDLLGRVTLLSVWASWCSSCRQEHPLLVQLAQNTDAILVGLNYKDTRQQAQRWLARYGDPYRVSLFDGDGRVGIDYGVYGVPETYIIDRRGIIRYKHIGPLTREVIDERILPLIGELERPAQAAYQTGQHLAYVISHQP